MLQESQFRQLQSESMRHVREVDLTHKRYLYNQINWDARLIGIRGARGTGKTTLLLQYIKEHYADLSKVLYVTLDSFSFQLITLYDVAEYAYTHGIDALFVDEVHYMLQWGQQIKRIFDSFADLKIVYTGSSMLQIDEAQTDLSRRQTVYDLHGFSFREYMLFKGIYRHEAVSLEDVLNNHASLEMEITSAIKPLMHFGDYLREGYYPFVLEAKQDYLRRLEQLMLLIIYQDIPHVEDISLATLQKAQKLLMILATQVPLEPNISILCREIGATRDIVIKLLHLMEKSGLLMLVNKESNSYKTLSRPDKIYLNNTNQMYALTHMVNEGTLRETFFVNQLRQAHSVLLPVKGDYLVDEHYTFEVGGASKSFDQIKNIPDSYLALDEMEYGSGNAIPLYLFGFLY